MKQNFYLGSHVGMNAKGQYLLGSAQEAINNGANTLMFFTGAPQNTIRTATEKLNIEAFQQLLVENEIDITKVICHGPYTINLANTIKPDTFELGVRLLKEELIRLEAIGVHTVVLHPGAAVGAERSKALESVANGLNQVYSQLPNTPVKVALETMSGKGTEVCITFEEIKYVLDRVERTDMVGVCFDTCHMHDAGYDVKNNFDKVVEEFDQIVGLDKLLAIHLNDSKNPINAHKDRHQNIGYGHIGFTALASVVHNPLFKEIPIVLETPWIDDKTSPYKAEIEMLKANQFKNNFGYEIIEK
ncbi:deoxyribonuclease IV [Spiroplasma culicicola]|uniref:Probable endonuclease 4 n=1 Tax=Spiroplasma culicicola AES-1 TaxID=1276246 RepID=W6A7Q1_9MOLU|nr:deoxyribonuclease IV [Spiroplasma culicicola]AHI52895.1 endonuclease IV [Spiroplasma culicicola AES-1]